MVLWPYSRRSSTILRLSTPCLAFYSLIMKKKVYVFHLCLLFYIFISSYRLLLCLEYLSIFFSLENFTHSSNLNFGNIFLRESFQDSQVELSVPIFATQNSNENLLYPLLNFIICLSSSHHTLSSKRQGLCPFSSSPQWLLIALKVDTGIVKIIRLWGILMISFFEAFADAVLLFWMASHALPSHLPLLKHWNTHSFSLLTLIHPSTFTLNTISSEKAPLALKLD